MRTQHSSYNSIRYLNKNGLSGLGTSSAEEYTQPAAMAAQFIPGVGQIASVVLSVGGKLLDSLFGWGDPNSQHDLSVQIVNGRIALANLRHQLGIADEFEIPPDFDISDDKDVANLSMIIVNEYLKKLPMDLQHATQVDFVANKSTVDSGTYGTANFVEEVWKAYPSSGERQDKYTTISHLKSDIEAAQGQETIAYQTPPPVNSIPMQSLAAPGTTAPVQSSTQMPVMPSSTLLIAGGVGLVLLVLLAAKD